MGVWERIAVLLFGLLDRYAYLMMFLVVLLEEAGVPLHIPADLVMVVAGTRIADGRMSLPLTLLLLEGATLLGASLLYWFAPRGQEPDLFEMLSSQGEALHALIFAAATAIAVLFLEPFYVAAGFALYVNRRVELEAWDVEQELRRAFER